MDLDDLLAITRGVAAGPTAAQLHGFDLVEAPRRVHLIVPVGRHVALPGECVVRRAPLRGEEVVLRRGLPVTSPLRTVVDCARWLPVPHAVAVADSALRRRSVRPAALARAAARARAGGGTSCVRQALALADGRSESVLESLARVALLAAGVPPPVLQLRILDDRGGAVARVDMAWPDAGLVLEVDGFAYHSSRREAHRDRVRANRLVLLGHRVLRAGWEEVVGAPQRLVASVSAALRR